MPTPAISRCPNGTRIGMVAQEAPAGPESLIDTVLVADRERAALLAEAETATDPAPHRRYPYPAGRHRGPSARPRGPRPSCPASASDAEQQQRPCRDFSGGWRMRVALAAVLFSEPDLLLLDEPTNHLDLEATLWLEDYLKRYPHTVLLVSHDRDLLNKVVDKIVHLEAVKLTLYSGGYDTFEQTRALKIANIAAAQKKQEAQRAHMQAFVDRFRYKASKARQAQSRIKMLARMEPIVSVAEEQHDRRSTSRARTSWRRRSSRSTTSRPAMSRASRCCTISICGSTRTTASRCSAPTATANRPWRSCWPGASSRWPAALRKSGKLRVGYFAQHQTDELDVDATPLQIMERAGADRRSSRSGAPISAVSASSRTRR